MNDTPSVPHPASSIRPVESPASLAWLGLGLMLPLLAGGNVLVVIPPESALPAFAATTLAVSLVIARERPASPAACSLPPLMTLLGLSAWWIGTLWLRPSTPRAGLEAAGLAAGVLLYVIVSRRLTRDTEIARFVLGLATGTFLTTIYGHHQYWVVLPAIESKMIEIYGRAPFLAINANFYSANCYAPFLAATLVLMAGAASRFPLLLWAPCAFVILITLVLTGSRATLALLPLAALMLLPDGWAGLRRRWRPLAAGLLLLFGAAALAASVRPVAEWIALDELWERALLGRIAIWRAAVAMIGDHALLGVGLGGFAARFPEYQVVDYYTRYPHNLLLEVFAELGVVGFVAISAFFVTAFRNALRHDFEKIPILWRSVTAGSVLLISHAMIDIDWHAPANAILLLLLLAVAQNRVPDSRC